MSSDSNYVGIVNYFESRYLYNLCQFSALALLLHDTILTFGTEVDVVWNRGKVTIAGCLHIVNRYAQIAVSISSLVLSFPVSDLTCGSLGVFQSIAMVLPYSAWAGLRMHALSNGNKYLSVLVLVLSAVYVVPNMVRDNAKTRILGRRSHGGISERSLPAVLVASRAAPMLGEFIALLWTFKMTWKRHSFASSAYGRAHYLNQEQPAFCANIESYSVPLLSNATTLALFITNHNQVTLLQQVIICFRDPYVQSRFFTTILISHYLLDLGRLARRIDDQANNSNSALVIDTIPTFVLSEIEADFVEEELD
ncbi:hypothetical protein C8Q74DRAFT_1219117 [Fomes fomentarius]|nr:hypothetical protein C8Q74DRAFT_1219117 [Fomes fomentarius]